MQLERRDFRAMIFYDYCRNLIPKECLDQLTTVFGDLSPDKATIYRWFNEFKWGRDSLDDETRTGRPPTAVNESNVIAVEKLIKQDRRITYELILDEIKSLSPPTLNEILHNHLDINNVFARWIPHRLTDDQKDRRVSWCKSMIKKFDNGKSKLLEHVVTGDETWIYQYDPESKRQSTVRRFPGEDNPTKVKRQRSAGKQMIATFFAKWGHVTTIPLIERKLLTQNGIQKFAYQMLHRNGTAN